MAEIKSVMMDSLSVNQVKTQAQAKVKKTSDTFGNYLDASKNSNASTKNVSTKQSNNNVKVTDSSKAQNKFDKISDLNSKENTTVEVDKKTIDMVNEKITDEVKDVLGIDDETLSNAMTALGLSPLDLLDKNNLAKLVLFINGSNDFTQLLTNEDMLNQLNALSDAVESINWEDMVGMSKEEFVNGEHLASGLENQFGENNVDTDIKSDIGAEKMVFDSSEEADADSKVSLQAAEDNVSDDFSEVESKVSVVKGENNETQQDASQADSNKDMSGDLRSQIIADSDVKIENQATVQNDFIQNLNQAVNDMTQTAKPETVKMQQMVDIVNQVVEKIKVSLGADSTTMEMQLNPEHLGKVLLNVSSKNGMMTAVFSVQSEEAKAALESQMFTLRENLELRELKVDAVEVNVSDFDFSHGKEAMNGGEQSKADNGNGKQMRFEFDDDESDEIISNEEKEAVRRRVMRDNGSQIDFTA